MNSGIADMDRFPTPTVDEVDRIAALGEPVLCNLLITQCYHELSAAMATRIAADADWCAFATWASKQAGQTIRKEDLARALEHALTTTVAAQRAAADVATLARPGSTPRDVMAFQRKVWQAVNPLAVVDRASAAVARGNQKVFAEIGREFARFAAACLNDPSYDADRIAAFGGGLRPGDPPDGQRYLRQAFTRTYQAFFEPDPKARAELMLLANLEIGLHEQTRLQPEIAAALEAWRIDPGPFARRLLEALFPRRGWLMYAALRLMRLLRRPTRLGIAIDHLADVVRKQVRAFLTEHLMVLTLPDEVRLRLGDDLKAGYPEALKRVANPDLSALLGQIDPTPDSLRETGAVDWADLAERLHFIADLFRCYAEWPDLREPPFAPGQVAMLKTGRVPDGRL